MRFSSPPGRIRAIIAGTVGLTMVGAGTLTLALPAAAESSRLVTAGKTAEATTVQDQFFASYVTDGDPATRWSSLGQDNQSVTVDLAETCIIDRVDLNWEGAFASKYTISGSTNNTDWETLATGTATGAGKISHITADATPDAPSDDVRVDPNLEEKDAIRFLRVTGDERGFMPYGISLYSVDGYGHGCTPLPAQPTPTPTPTATTPGSTPTAGPIETDLGTLVSRGAKASASSVQNPDFPAKNVTDGIGAGPNGTRWSSNNADNEWISIDLGATYIIDALGIDWEGAYATKYTIDTSVNGWTWTPYASGSKQNANRDEIKGDTSPRARFVRLTAQERLQPTYGVSIWEFEVYGHDREEIAEQHAEGKGPGGLLSYQKPGKASSSQDDPQCPGCTVDKMFDMDLSSRWSVAEKDWSDNAWVQVDLGKTAEINQIALRWENAYAKGYDIEIADSENGPWNLVYRTIGGQGGKEVINIDPTEGRFVRVTMNDRPIVWAGQKFGYSIYEFRVYGTGGDPIAPPELPKDPDFDNLKLVWSDEFDGTAGSGADPHNWTLDHTAKAGDNNNAELQLYTADTNNVRHDGKGNLIVEAKVEDFHGAKFYSSGRLNTSHKVHAQYGRFEARVKVPEGKGLWPAFWMMGSSFLDGRPWPNNGEIDIMEVLGHAPEETHGTVHGPGYSGMGGQGGAYTLPDKTNLSKDFHVWAAEWNSEKITFLLDGNEVYTVTRDHVENTLDKAWVFDQEFYIILNLAVGGDWPGSPNADTQFPAQMLVDYVRVYQSEGSGKLTIADPITTPTTPTVTPSEPTVKPTVPPVKPTTKPGEPTTKPTVTPGEPTATPSEPTATPGQPTDNPGEPTTTPVTATPSPSATGGGTALSETGAGNAGPQGLIALLLVLGGVGVVFAARRTYLSRAERP
ncbi:discoidin domain-containing protein [Mycetocola tolaasinivorans]|nr:discoidin domain-containing protein [Mycetocola tolaasinivorans]